jgi:hypothetical protein
VGNPGVSARQLRRSSDEEGRMSLMRLSPFVAWHPLESWAERMKPPGGRRTSRDHGLRSEPLAGKKLRLGKK